MRIKRGRFYINSDSRCYWITEEFKPEGKKAKKDLSEKRVTGYFRDLEDCYKDFVDKRISGSEAKTMTKLMEDIGKLKEEVKELMRDED